MSNAWCGTCATGDHEYVNKDGCSWDVTVATNTGSIYEVGVLLLAGSTFKEAIEEALDIAEDDPEARLVTIIAKRGER